MAKPVGKIKKVWVGWAIVDEFNHYEPEIFRTRNEAEAYRRGVRHIQDGVFKIKKAELFTEEL